MKKTLTLVAVCLCTLGSHAQRPTDILDRGLVAMKVSNGVYVGWKIFAEEYYDVSYNLYRDGVKVNRFPLTVSNYTDPSGSTTSTYQVAPIVRGVEQAKCNAVNTWANQYYDISVQPVYSRNNEDVTTSHNYIINDISLADVDGDGKQEFIVKRLNGSDLTSLSNKTCFNFIECYKMDGTRLWYIDCGPNTMSGSNVELNAVAYDWDGDGKAEVLMRGADNMIIHMADGSTQNVGDMTVDTRWEGIEYTTTGAEYLLYLNGETAKPYVVMDYPLPRYDAGEANDEGSIWGSGIPGHRPTKHFFGAPFLDGRHASIFLARGIYTREKMVALDVDPATHQLSERWRWKCYDSSSPWFGNGYHNYQVADVDWDGRDEIVYGSMVIDDNGKGLSTTGFGHGDAQHCGDLDPYRHGQEQFACNESQPAMNYRNATTSEIYYRLKTTGDDGRALCGNFTNDYPGCIGRSTASGMISCVADKVVSEKENLIGWNDLNFRIYWDDDLCEEVLNSPGTEKEAKIEKPGKGRIFTSSGCNMCNWTKNTPCVQADILGDWREEIVLRADNNTKIRIYVSNIETPWRNYTLWHDHQYRQAMVWQMCGYNQPPHTSYFLGEMEGITIAPPPLTMTGRTEIANNGTIGTANNDQHVMVCETNNTTINVADGATPYIATFNVPSWTQGHDNNKNITTEKFTCTVKGGAFAGKMRLVKQGDGVLTLPAVDEAYTGNTDIWAGTLNFDGKMTQSSVWLNRFAELNSNNGTFRSIKMDYASILRPGGENNKGNITTDSLKLGFGSRIVFDIYSNGNAADHISTKYLSIEKKDWKYGPKYLSPVIEFSLHPADGEESIAEGKYLLGDVTTLEGNLSNLVIEGTDKTKKNVLTLEDGKLYLVIEGTRDASTVMWTGTTSDVWNVAVDNNFAFNTPGNTDAQIFVNGDNVIFSDEATQPNVSINEELNPDSIMVTANTTAYTFKGTGKISGNASLHKSGDGKLTISTDNTYTGGNHLSGGNVSVSTLASSTQAYGNLGAVTTTADKFTMENGATLTVTAATTNGSPMKMIGDEGGVISNTADLNMERPISGTTLTKKGSGWMKLNVANSSLNKLSIVAGTVQVLGNTFPAKTVEFNGGTLAETGGGSSFTINVPEGKKGTHNLTERGSYSNKLTGNGTLTVWIPMLTGYEGTPRTQLKGDWSAFEGTLKATTYSSKVKFTFDNSYGMPKAVLDLSSGVTVGNSGKSFAIGSVIGNGNLGGSVSFSQSAPSGTNTWKVGDDTNFKFDGKVTDTGTCFVKTGTGKMTVNGVWDNTGTTTINAGTLQINSGAKLGTGSLTVGKDGTLTGTTGSTSALSNMLYTINGTLQVGTLPSSTSGVIKFGDKNVTFSTTSKYVVGMRKCATASASGGTEIANIKKLTMNGTISLFFSSSYTPAEGDSIRLWECTTFAGTPKFDLPALEGGLTWDTSRISEGYLFIKADPNAINSVNASEAVTVSVTNASGAVVTRFNCQYADVEDEFRRAITDKGVYLLHIKGKGIATTLKIMR